MQIQQAGRVELYGVGWLKNLVMATAFIHLADFSTTISAAATLSPSTAAAAAATTPLSLSRLKLARCCSRPVSGDYVVAERSLTHHLPE